MEHTARNFHAHGGAEWGDRRKADISARRDRRGSRRGCSICPVAANPVCPTLRTAKRARWRRSGRTSTRCSPPCGKPASWQARRSSEVRMDARLGG